MALHLAVAAVVLHAIRGCVAQPLVPAHSSCPVTLVQVAANGEKDGKATEGLRLDEGGLKYLAELPSPLFLVPMLGVYRGGKSMLLNRLRGLKAPYKDGFGIGHGQSTFTRGIQVCAEAVDGLGTVVWMDTEGLFSSEEAHSAYGPKVFSLALLFSSTVLLNSVKVLNDQFFAFFGEQQQFARVLRQGLADEGLPQEGMLPGNLSVFWVLQQPINYDRTGSATAAQLEAFLEVKGDETRGRVNRDFQHMMHEVPVASYDYNAWTSLDKSPDSELVGDYISASNHLRERVFSELRNARPLQADAAAKQLEMYVELVQTERFSGALAKETFELSEISSLCNSFKQKATELAGPLPSTSLEEAFAEAKTSLEEKRLAVIEKFHLGGDWSRKFEACLQDRIADVQRENAELLLKEWQTTAGKVAEDGSCFFLGELDQQLKDYGATYGAAFGADAQARALEYARALQRTRLVECVRLRHFMWPFLPWLASPIGGIYLQKGIMSGFMNLCVHAVALAGIYVLLQFFGRLPVYLDSDYPVLRAHPMILNLTMSMPPSVPWYNIGLLFGLAGGLRSLYKLLKELVYLSRPAGAAHTTGQMLNLEHKLNILLKRSEATIKHDIASAALAAAECVQREDARGAALALLRGFCGTRDFDGQDPLQHMADSQFQRRLREVLATCQVPRTAVERGAVDKARACCKNELMECVLQGDFEDLLNEMLRLLCILVEPHDIKSLKGVASPAASPASCTDTSATPGTGTAASGTPGTLSPQLKRPAALDEVRPRNLDQSLREEAVDDDEEEDAELMAVGDEEDSTSAGTGSWLSGWRFLLIGAVPVVVTALAVTEFSGEKFNLA